MALRFEFFILKLLFYFLFKPRVLGCVSGPNVIFRTRAGCGFKLLLDEFQLYMFKIYLGLHSYQDPGLPS